MHFKIHALASSSILGLLALYSSQGLAHPDWYIGGINVSTTTPGPTGEVTRNPRDNGSRVDSIRINHGCDGEAIEGVSWLWPAGLGKRMSGNRVIDKGMAPMSTQCDPTGRNCTGAGEQPSVATIPNSALKPTVPEGQGTATTLAEHLVEPTNINCTSVNHSYSCTWSPGETPITTLAGRMKFQGNLNYFRTNVDKANGTGFWAKGNKFTAEQLVEMGVTSAAAPYHNNVQIRTSWKAGSATNFAAGDNIEIAFNANSCARKLVVRVAGADICHLSPSRAEVNDVHATNWWFAGPTKKYGMTPGAHGSHENFWMGYVLSVRDKVNNPYPATCKDPANGDYDLVVMPTIKEIDDNLHFPGFATLP